MDAINERLYDPARGIAGVTPGTIGLVAVFLMAFMVYYFTNWKLLSVVWKVG
ncbi:MAG: hypothetical protein U0163_09455 [Gemmatimonadaceae bacterium]